jgi:hydrocephalus-inducing protein
MIFKVIDASIRAFMKNKNSLWTVSPKKIHLAPGESLQVDVSLTIDEKQPMNDILHFVVHEGTDLQINVKARGSGTPVTTKEPNNLEVIDFKHQYATQTITRDIVIENRGKKARRLVWKSDKLEALQKYLAAKAKEEGGDQKPNKKNAKAEAAMLASLQPVFSVNFDNIQLEGKTAFRYYLLS